MLKDNWISALKVAGIILPILILSGYANWSSYQPDEQKSSYADRQCDKYKLEHSKLQWPVVGKLDKSRSSNNGANQPDSKKKDDTDWCDLAAQERMAESTFWMMVAAWAAFILTFIGVWLLIRTLYYTRDTAESARSAAEAAWETNKTYSVAFKQEQRAYVGIEKIEFEFGSEPDGYRPAPLNKAGVIYRDFIVTKVKNFGHTPAYDVSVYCGATGVPFLHRLPTAFDIDERIARNGDSSNIITSALLNRDQSEIIKSGILDARPFWAAERRENTIFVFGRIYYKDAWQRSWSTRFCYTWEPWHPSGPRFVPTDSFNDVDQSENPNIVA